jgi:uncharacterized protein YlaI
MTGPARFFTCQLCGRRVHTHDLIEDVVAEATANFGPIPEGGSEAASVCDDCYQRVMTWAEAAGLPKQWRN